MNLLDWINQGITNLVNTSSPSIDALGFRMFAALLTTMMVWFGVQEALSSAEGRSGFSVAKFVEFVVIASFAYTLIEFYDSTIPGVGYSFKDFITIGANSLANMIGQDSVNQLNQTITGMQNQLGSGILKAIMNEYYDRDGARAGALGSVLSDHRRHHCVRCNRSRCGRYSRTDFHPFPAG